MLGLLASYMLRLLRSGPRAHALGTGPPDPLRGIAAAAAAGDTAAQRTLLIETGSALLRTVRAVLGANSTELEDVLQEAMTAVHLALPSFRGECSTLHFVCRLGVHTAMNARRRGRIRARHIDATDDAELVELARDDVSPAEQLTAARRRATLRQLLAELPELQAEVLALHTMLGYTVEETAQVTGAPVNTVRSRLRAALSALREGVGRREATRSRSGGLVTDERRRASHRVEDLSILARRGALSTVEQRALTRALTSSPTLATAHQLGLDFDRFAAVRPGDDALIAAVASRVTSGKRGTARGRRRLRAVLLVAVLTSAGTAAAWWKRARAPAVTSLPAARLPSASRATRAAPHAADTGAELGAA
ncbi:MAG TPA: sigma-70 family RNA polymerase sigma factor, partial [Polyangiaceae bacterium]|nr:sigma-70 family RNA polymerase sigma factor [Polyangiaceae bacterium]